MCISIDLRIKNALNLFYFKHLYWMEEQIITAMY